MSGTGMVVTGRWMNMMEEKDVKLFEYLNSKSWESQFSDVSATKVYHTSQKVM
jgi:hypothetical protein